MSSVKGKLRMGLPCFKQKRNLKPTQAYRSLQAFGEKIKTSHSTRYVTATVGNDVLQQKQSYILTISSLPFPLIGSTMKFEEIHSLRLDFRLGSTKSEQLKLHFLAAMF